MTVSDLLWFVICLQRQDNWAHKLLKPSSKGLRLWTQIVTRWHCANHLIFPCCLGFFIYKKIQLFYIIKSPWGLTELVCAKRLEQSTEPRYELLIIVLLVVSGVGLGPSVCHTQARCGLTSCPSPWCQPYQITAFLSPYLKAKWLGRQVDLGSNPTSTTG